jgi:pimeloyl-ACP methyl ester carboxylesterase
MLDALSPPRRRLVLALLALAAAAALALAGLVAVRGLGGDRPTARPPVDVQPDEPGPVLLRTALEAAGRQVRVLPLPGDGQGDLREQARALRDAADELLRATGAGSVDVVGYSAGGVVARLWAQELGGSQQARRIVTLGSPHHGTSLAALAETLAPGECPTACRQLVPGNDLLDELNADETPSGPAYIAVWTTRDQTVVPPTSGRLDGATNIELQSVCADATTAHGDLPRDPLVVGLVLRQLSAEPVLEPGPADCAPLRAAGS